MLVAVLSDIHANLAALRAVLDDAGTVDAVRVLGDTVGYGPEPDSVVELLVDRGALAVRGNHDVAAIDGEGIDWFNPNARTAIEWTRRRIVPATRDWLAGLPARFIEGPLTLVHGSPRDPIWEYVTDPEVATENLPFLATPYCLFGHTHVPIAYRREGRLTRAIRPAPGAPLDLDDRALLANPGSVGQPRDGDPAASWLLFDSDGPSLSWRRTPYDIGATQAAMRVAGLPAPLIARLERGR